MKINSNAKYLLVILFIMHIVIACTSGSEPSDSSEEMDAPIIDTPTDDEFQDVPIQSIIEHVQPMTGIVFWADSDANDTDAIQLEYSYVKYSDVVTDEGQYNWQAVDDLLAEVALREHQAILRFYYVMPGDDETTVPQYIKDNAQYVETEGQSEGQATGFPDWSFDGLESFTLEFYTRFAQRYDNDPRIAFLQVGFGLWAEYHIYDGPMELGRTFPSKSFQSTFIRHMDETFDLLPWSISIDASQSDVSPFGDDSDLLDIQFGLFDDSFLHETHAEENGQWFNFFSYRTRSRYSPMGGELSYYSSYDQQHALDPDGPHGISFEELAAQYNISYMIGNDQPAYQSMARIAEAGMAIGYKFRITSFKASASQSKVTVLNYGIAPIYFDAYAAVNGLRSLESLKGLQPGQSIECTIDAGGSAPVLTIESDRLVPGQVIGFEANL